MSREIKVLHLEPTDVCQAACPLCARETDLDFDKSSQHHLTIEQIQHHINDAGIKNLNKLFMCGNWGAPAAGKYTLDIYQHFRKINPEIELGMNTNGAIQNAAWWQTLGETFHRQRDYVVFSIDGLEDTNHVYRVNVQWHRVMENVRSFIKAGGSAHWDMLVYAHNQHQVNACQQLARDMGFKWFRTKVSKRNLANDLQYPIQWQPNSVAPPVQCHALQEQSLYMDARGIIYPCCWHGHRDSQVHDLHQVSWTWKTESPNHLCLQTCGTVSASSTNFANQWRRSVELIN